MVAALPLSSSEEDQHVVRRAMSWQDFEALLAMRESHTHNMGEWISSSPSILDGKPCVRGTRISVEHIMELLASGASREDILRAHPQITAEGLAAALQYAARSLKNEVIWDLKIPA